MICVAKPSAAPAADWHAGFLKALPIIRRRASFVFRHLPAEDHEEQVAATVALAMDYYQRLARRGRADAVSATSLARVAILGVRCGRSVGGSMNHRDVLSVQTKLRHGIRVTRLGDVNQEDAAWQESLADNRQSPVPDQAAFRIDFPAWLASLPARNRRIARALATGLSTSEAAQRFGLSWGRISQLRREFFEGWRTFHGERSSVPQTAAA